VSRPREPLPAALVASLLSAREEPIDEALGLMTARFGPLAEAGEPLPFEETAYYAAELGRPLVRRLARFAPLVAQDTLAEIKLACLEIEGHLSVAGRRRVNIDPGLLTAERLILATGKNYTHRVPLKGGIFADLTLIFAGVSFRPLPWTYPDYASEAMISLLNRLRAGYIAQLKEEGRLGRGVRTLPGRKACSGA
jgi:hypothetical protein